MTTDNIQQIQVSLFKNDYAHFTDFLVHNIMDDIL